MSLFDEDMRRTAEKFMNKPGDIYHILGCFKQADESHIFVGTFQYYKPTAAIISGNITDEFGESKIINGRMNSKFLEFEKYYFKPNQDTNMFKSTWKYRLKNQNGLWIGEYDGQTKDSRVKAITEVAYKNIFYKDNFEKNLSRIFKLIDKTSF